MGLRLVLPFRAALIAAIVSMLGTGAWAGDFRLLELEGNVVKWGRPQLGSGATVSYALAARAHEFPDARNCPSLLPIDGIAQRMAISVKALEQQLASAFAAWEKIADIQIRPARSPEEADILVGAQGRPRGRAFTNVSPAVGATHRIVSAGFARQPSTSLRSKVSTIERSLICLNPEQDWKSGFDGNLEAYDIGYTLMHEMGHAIGLDHPGASGELMSFRYEETFRGLQEGDIAGAIRLYGPKPRPAP